MKNRVVKALALVAAGATLAACGSDGDSDGGGSGSGDPYRLAVVYGVSGAYAGFAKDYLAGANAAVDAINAKGGINGRKIDLKIVDDKSNPTFAVTALTKLLSSDYKPDAIIPGGVSTEVQAMLPKTTQAQLLSVNPASNPALNDPKQYPYNFGTFALQTYNLTPIGEALKQGGVKKLGVVISGDAFGDSLLSGIKAMAEDAGAEIVDTERPAADAANYDVEVQRVVGKKPDAVFFDFSSQDAIGRFLTSRTTVGATDIPFYGGTGVAASALSSLGDPESLANCSIPVYSFTVANESKPAYLQPLLDAFKGSPDGILSGGLGWDDVYLAALAFERSPQDTSGESLARALVDKPVPANYLAGFPSGVTYTADNHFPTPGEGSFSLVSCAAKQKDGLWVQ